NIPLKVLPVGINYSSFRKFGKNIFLNFGNIISKDEIDITQPDGIRNKQFNQKLENELKNLVYEIPGNDIALQKQMLAIPISSLKRSLLILPALIGFFLHAPLYLAVKRFTFPRTHDNDHFDSVM